MMNTCEETLEAKLADRNERARKLYRYVSEVARRIDELTASCKTTIDHFATHIEIQRQKLRDNCEKLLFLDPVKHGKKSLELLWRKAYYETVAAAKKTQDPIQEYDSYLFTHIVCGIGHFHNIVSRIKSELKVQYMELDYIPLHRDEETEELIDLPSEDVLNFGRSAIHSCLIYLGDLSRYQAEMFHTFSPSIAARYYLQAAHIDMSSGMPYNQLGNLYLEKNYNLDSVSYYIQCLYCKVPFEGAMENLTKIFEKCVPCPDIASDTEPFTQAEHIQYTVANFLSLIEIWYFNKTDSNIHQRCNTIVAQIKIALEFSKIQLPDINKNYNEYLQAIEEQNTNPSYLNGNLIHKMVQICLMTMTKVSETDKQSAFACKAFALALLSQLLQMLQKQLQELGLINPAVKYYNRGTSKEQIKLDKDEESIRLAEIKDPNLEVVTNGNIEFHEELTDLEKDSKKIQNGDVKNGNKKVLKKRRRRRRIASSESSDVSDAEIGSSDTETGGSCSEEYLSDSTLLSDDDSKSDCSTSEEMNEKLNNTIVNEKIQSKIAKENHKPIDNHKDFDNESSRIDVKSTSNIKEQDIQKFLQGDNFLPSIKLLQDWVLTEKDLILSCGESGEPFFQCVVDLLNIFTFYFNHKNNEYKNIKILNFAKRIGQNLKLEYKKIPLPEDINLRGTQICKFDKDAAEWQILEKYQPTVYEENIIRILNFIDFGNQVAKIVHRIRFNRTMKVFYLKKNLTPKLNTKLNHRRTREWHNSKKQPVEIGEGGLLRRLGRLWLAFQVRELESSESPAPAFLALDAAALYKHIRRVKQLLRTRKFVLLIPTVVLQELDDLKRECSSARDAIRWLEVQLKSGSRCLRAQKPGQFKPLPLLKYPRKSPPHVHNFIHILEFCNHFIADEKQNHGGNGDVDNSPLQGKSAPLLILLVGNEINGNEDQQYKEFSLTGAAKSAGISVEYIVDFYLKWRQSLHKSGKKR